MNDLDRGFMFMSCKRICHSSFGISTYNSSWVERYYTSYFEGLFDIFCHISTLGRFPEMSKGALVVFIMKKYQSQ